MHASRTDLGILLVLCCHPRKTQGKDKTNDRVDTGPNGGKVRRKRLGLGYGYGSRGESAEAWTGVDIGANQRHHR